MRHGYLVPALAFACTPTTAPTTADTPDGPKKPPWTTPARDHEAPTARACPSTPLSLDGGRLLTKHAFRAALDDAVTGAIARARRCGAPADLAECGVVVVICSDGIPSSVAWDLERIDEPAIKYRRTEWERCVLTPFREMRLPPFGGDPLTVRRLVFGL